MSHLRPGLPSGLLPPRSPTIDLYVSHKLAIVPTYFAVLSEITQIMLGDQRISRNMASCGLFYGILDRSHISLALCYEYVHTLEEITLNNARKLQRERKLQKPSLCRSAPAERYPTATAVLRT
jgi:hypothetical protein